MWSRRQGRLRPTVCGVEELRRRRREREHCGRRGGSSSWSARGC
ncbi:TMCO6 isoform 8 [Pan troglodytes]|uniref:Transmembrane and coiled-coil domains 6 n=3 Tax=Hominidae TaxID=9604 RepID=D6REQ9_HUMAN|nr:TMCO6 isoform 4 [Pan troglodytes]PNJ59353.1 TMCO6 isoform 7 [Pongo abelii]PNI22663.1 TMCO6 isoform 5 [Pan troglodytes]PNI22665.1 TMCO6 isoform 8 [Pan troglodytes]PNJ59355.1 TMCO6 isoform 11 [Pongo abelii]